MKLQYLLTAVLVCKAVGLGFDFTHVPAPQFLLAAFVLAAGHELADYCFDRAGLL